MIEYVNDDASSPYVTTYKNTYKNSLLTKVVISHSYGSKETVKVTYKKTKVPASYKAAVKKQQASAMLHYVDGLTTSLHDLPLGSF